MDMPDGGDAKLKDFESWEEAKQAMQDELYRTRTELRELERKIQQSRVEVDKLVKRNAAVTASLQRVQEQIDSTPSAEVKSAYDAALEALQRLMVMRGQMERLQDQQVGLVKYQNLLEGINQTLGMGMSNEPGSAGSFATVEMMIRAQEAERQRLSRQMHDGPAQALSNFILQSEIATRLFDVDQERARDELQVLKTSAATTFQQVRDYIFQLRPMMLDDLGLVPTVKRYVDAVKNQTGLDIEVTVTGTERRLESYLEVVIFRSVQELLTNALTHSQATEIQVQLDLVETEVRTSIEDNGKGFDPKMLDSESHMGLRLIRERTEMLGGYFEIDSVQGQGTRVLFRVPIARMAEMA
jgi:two-component system sensor histidine kinase DegS